MTFLKPLGFLALISLALLLLIYILKPNFQQKFISSTHIWKLSLKYKKKKLPINKLRNILLIICQVLILLGLTAVLLNPVKILKTPKENEYIIIIDASSSMKTYHNDETRFDRAVEMARNKADELYNENGTVSVVIATSEPYFLVERATVESRWDVDNELSKLNTLETCTYGTADLSKATELCQDILYDNPTTKAFCYTDLEVDYVPEGLTVINVSNNAEYNVAILNAYAEIIDNYYSFVVDLASYGRDISISLNLEVYNANVIPVSMPDGTTFTFNTNVDLVNDQTKRIIFINSDIDTTQFPDDENTIYYLISDTDKIFTYKSVFVSIDEDDDYQVDNMFSIYGGTKEPLKVLYASSNSNPFFNGVLLTLQSALNDRFDVQITEYKIANGALPTEGYDLYIYEHDMQPLEAPKDGVVIYADPLLDVNDSGFRFKYSKDLDRTSLPLTEEKAHEIIKNVYADNITVSRYSVLSSVDANYEVLMTCDNDPVLLVRNEENMKSVIMLFSLHYSNLPLLKDFPLLMYNIFDYFMPPTIIGNSFEVDDVVQIRSRSDSITIEGNDINLEIEDFPNTISLDIPGTYTISQTTYFNKDIKENIYVTTPAAESNIFSEIETIDYQAISNNANEFIEDLIFLLTLGLTAFIFIEWLLKGNDAI